MATYSSNSTIAMTVYSWSGSYGAQTLYTCPSGRYADVIVHHTNSTNLTIVSADNVRSVAIPTTAFNGSRATYSLGPSEKLTISSAMILDATVVEYRPTP